MGKQVWAAEISTKNLSNDLKEKLFRGSIPGRPIFGNKKRGFDELFVLQTGAQFLVFGVGDSVDPLLNFFLQEPELFQNVHFYRTTEASINLLFATSSGLNSTIKGGKQVLRDIENSRIASLHSKGVALTLDTLIQQSLIVGEKVRESTGLENLGTAIFESTLDEIQSDIGALHDVSVLVIGEGDVARCAMDFFSKAGAGKIVAAVQSSDSAKELEDQYGVSTVLLSEVKPFFHMADVVINDDSSGLAVHKDVLQLLQGPVTRKVMLDFSVESEFQRELRTSPLITLYTLEDMQHSPMENANLFYAVEEAWRLVEEEAIAFASQLDLLSEVPLLSSCWNNIVRKNVTEKLNSRCDLHPVSPMYVDLVALYNQTLLKSKKHRDLEISPMENRQSTYAYDCFLPFLTGNRFAYFSKNQSN